MSDLQLDARKAMYRALNCGILVRGDRCESCGAPSSEDFGLDGHHYLGYEPEHWLDVQWLCRSCHMREHRTNSTPHENFIRSGRTHFESSTSEEWSALSRFASRTRWDAEDRTPTMCDCGAGPFKGSYGLKLHQRQTHVD